MPTTANTTSYAFAYEREQTGRYAVFLVAPRVRLGLLLGRSGHWLAEDASGRTLTAFNTRGDGAKALLNRARLDKRV